MEKKIVRIEEISLGIGDDEALLKSKVAQILDLPESDVLSYAIVRKNIDSRKKDIRFVYNLDVVVENIAKIKEWNTRHRVRLHEPYVYKEKKAKLKNKKNIVVVGSGPCGLFTSLLLARAGLKTILIERGKDVDSRVKDVDVFLKNGTLNPKSNIQFGEGGAGTFSDGKLYTLINDPRSKYIFAELIKAGAPKEIAWNGTPHIGTDRLREVIKNIRKELIRLGVEIRFETCLADLKITNNKLEAIVLDNNDIIETDQLVLAIGHSARDTYKMLYERKLLMKPKAFSIGLRIEHQASMINKALFGESYSHPKLGTAKYKMVAHSDVNRSVYTFCMCPGGYVVASSSEEGMLVVNGMSEYAQDGENSNSALLVPVEPSDYDSEHPLAGIEFQRKWEKQAFILGGSNYFAPVQLVGDFLKKQESKKLGSVKASYRPGIRLTTLDSCLPDFVIDSIREAIPKLDKKLKGFASPDAVLTGVETRSSSPLRLERDINFESNIKGIYPAGEGAGYAGGIVSSAIDGIKVAETIIGKYIL